MKGCFINAKQLNSEAGDDTFILTIVVGGETRFVASNSFKDVGDYAAEKMLDINFEKIDISDMTVIRGDILNVRDLPFEFDGGESGFVIYGGDTIVHASRMEHVTTFIETGVNKYKADIEDFAVISGYVLPVAMSSSLAARITKLRRETGLCLSARQ